MPLPKEKINRILVITLSNVGDCLLTLPVFRALRTHFPSAKMGVVVGERGKNVFLNDPRFEKVFVYDKTASLAQKLHFIREMRRWQIDLTVDLRHSLFPILVGSPYRTTLFSRPTSLHRLERHLERLAPLGLSGNGWSREDLWIPPLAQNRMETLLEAQGLRKDRPFVAISPGSRSDLKRWGEKSYARLCERLIRERQLPILFVGESSDRSTVDAVTSYLKEKSASLVGETSIQELAVLLQWTKVLVTNDSATLHLATLVGCPTVALFGPTDPRKYGPRGKAVAVVRKELFCSPCERPQCPYHHECMEQMSVEEVYQACCAILASP